MRAEILFFSLPDADRLSVIKVYCNIYPCVFKSDFISEIKLTVLLQSTLKYLTLF